MWKTLFYAQAEAVAPHDPVYASNLSATLYELGLGKYAGCIDAIMRSWKHISTELHDSLLLELSSRLPRSLCQGIRSGTISQGYIYEKRDLFEQMYSVGAPIAQKDLSVFSEYEKLWAEWRFIDNESTNREAAANEARNNLSLLPILRKPL